MFQVNSIDEPLRNALLSALDFYVLPVILNPHNYTYNYNYSPSDALELVERFLTSLWIDHYKLRFKSRPDDFPEWHEFIEDRLRHGQWYEVYDFIEYALRNFPFSIADTENVKDSKKWFTSMCNRFLEREMSAWRIVRNQVARLTSDAEIQAVEQAQTFEGPVGTHLTTAVGLLSDRKNPDYRNSIKESISAVEAMCCKVTEKSKADLGSALNALEQKGIRLHGALKNAFNSLYGYTSGAGGIRHKLMDDPKVDFEDAKFMLVSCSAFVNLLGARIK